jgi:FkbM family methyltransferase
MVDHRLTPIEYCSESVISAAQNLEDVLLFRALRGKREGFYIDLGAGYPNWDSVTNWFYRIGWTGINVEPNPAIFAELQEARPRDVNLNAGVSGKAGIATYYQVSGGWGLSTFARPYADQAARLGYQVAEFPVELITLEQIVAAHCPQRQVDFLKIDVEGSEDAIIHSTDWRRFRPLLICVESVVPASFTPAFTGWEGALVQHGFVFALFDGLNNYYVRQENPEILPQFNAGVNVWDRFRKATEADFSVARKAAPAEQTSQ